MYVLGLPQAATMLNTVYHLPSTYSNCSQLTTQSCTMSLSKTIPATCCLSKRPTTNMADIYDVQHSTYNNTHHAITPKPNQNVPHISNVIWLAGLTKEGGRGC